MNVCCKVWFLRFWPWKVYFHVLYRWWFVSHQHSIHGNTCIIGRWQAYQLCCHSSSKYSNSSHRVGQFNFHIFCRSRYVSGSLPQHLEQNTGKANQRNHIFHSYKDRWKIHKNMGSLSVYQIIYRNLTYKDYYRK